MTTSHSTSAFRSHWPWAAIIGLLLSMFGGALRIGEIMQKQTTHDAELQSVETTQAQMRQTQIKLYHGVQGLDDRLDILTQELRDKRLIAQGGN